MGMMRRRNQCIAASIITAIFLIMSVAGCVKIESSDSGTIVVAPVLEQAIDPIEDDFFLGRWQNVDPLFDIRDPQEDLEVTSESGVYLYGRPRYPKDKARLFKCGDRLYAQVYSNDPSAEEKGVAFLFLIEKGRNAFRLRTFSPDWLTLQVGPLEANDNPFSLGFEPVVLDISSQELCDLLAEAPDEAFDPPREGAYYLRVETEEDG